MNMFDIHGEALVLLVTDLESQEAFEIVMDDIFRGVWRVFSGSPVEMVAKFMAFEKHPVRSNTDKLLRRLRHWSTEGHRRLAAMRAPVPANSPATRKGYRAEVFAWMKRKNINTVDLAAKRLAVSESTLKSIMSSREIVRYSSATLKRILDELGK
jgi:hypothetical protein